MALAPSARARRRISRSCLVLLGAAVVALGAVGSAVAAGATASAVATSSANPPTFIPNWDGHTDSTMLDYTLLVRSRVVVQVVDGRGSIVDTLERSTRPAGTHVAVWDGRTTTGRVLPAGTYRIRITATPLERGSDEPGEANAGVGIVNGTRDVAVVLEQSPVSVTAVRLTRGSLGRAKQLSMTRARFQLSAPAAVSAVVINASGGIVRTLHTGRMNAGERWVDWRGVGGSGRPVADGDYTLLVAAAGGGRPSETLRQPLRVDRTVPVLRTKRAVRTVSSARAVTIPLVVSVSEPSKVSIRIGRRTVTADKAAGTHRLSVPGSSLGLRPARSIRRLPAVVSAVDSTGNARTLAVTLVVPAASKTVKVPARTPVKTPVAPPVSPPTNQGPQPVSGAFGWPAVGVVSSPFGPRGGRMHQGIDIAAPGGTPIHPATAGVVNFVGDRADCYGNVVVLDHPNGVQTWYAHQSKLGRFVVGDRVDRLDVIGYVGTTGCSTGDHVHFEVRIGGKARNPMAYLAKR
ncbi:MAG: metalloendopeptidase-like rane protein [Thermoleophilia bacterium]|nr:metalloendopeptidase-like rane protein [Thermoleophilia bacterium]